jgi:hypothetical protein
MGTPVVVPQYEALQEISRAIPVTSWRLERKQTGVFGEADGIVEYANIRSAGFCPSVVNHGP